VLEPLLKLVLEVMLDMVLKLVCEMMLGVVLELVTSVAIRATSMIDGELVVLVVFR
jgi:hypothetical protein